MELTRRGVFALTAAASLTLCGGAGAAAATEEVIARTALGRLRGLRQGGVCVWRGVPYAQPPERFAPARPVQPWQGVRSATEFGPTAMQIALGPGGPSTATRQSEDCLYLNVWSPGTTGRRPVVVWIHGGAFVSGAGSDYDGTQYAALGDTVFVTINYRLGAFGYLYQADRPGSGNLALTDQIAALRWVRQNIAAFGGDPDTVTVMGESAGGMSIGYLLGMPTARGLFRRAVVQSGGARPLFTPEQAAKTTAAVREALGGADPKSVTAEQLRTASAAVAKDSALGGEPFHQVVDGGVVPAHPLEQLDSQVDVMIGTCRDESNVLARILPLFAKGLPQHVKEVVGTAKWAQLQRVYRDSTPSDRDWELDLLSACFTVMPSVWLAEAAHNAGARVWQYRFDYADASPTGPVHAADLMFTFNSVEPDLLAPKADLAVARAVARRVFDGVVAFARDGNPGWAAFEPVRRCTMLFDAEPGVREDRIERVQREAWRGVRPTHF
ncbi:carboxylesterase/lipase family protein [Kutzneria viridogrisea]|uniref:Carboxylic ester hydrolase n=1 Tax=Kutzneria viridogrisea TaxID=47990 RepID=A0ABR6B7N2_9PSEU|nr:para-nitrobenzyl esterase [Kutzneria viridogrisea]